jgi:uncharacterized damage-inducible protein DinB
MTDERIFATETAAAWENARQGVIDELELVAEADLDFRPSPKSRTIRELVLHILESECVIAGEALRPDGDFHRKPWPELVNEYAADVLTARSKDELLAALRRQKENAERIRNADPAFMRQQIRTLFGYPATRLSVLQFGISHEFYHRGQLAMCVRMLGMTPALTRKFEPAT